MKYLSTVPAFALALTATLTLPASANDAGSQLVGELIRWGVSAAQQAAQGQGSVTPKEVETQPTKSSVPAKNTSKTPASSAGIASDIEYLAQCRGWEKFSTTERKLKAMPGVKTKVKEGLRTYELGAADLTVFGLKPLEVWFAGEQASGFTVISVVFKEPASRISAKNRGKDGFSNFSLGKEKNSSRSYTHVTCDVDDEM